MSCIDWQTRRRRAAGGAAAAGREASVVRYSLAVGSFTQELRDQPALDELAARSRSLVHGARGRRRRAALRLCNDTLQSDPRHRLSHHFRQLPYHFRRITDARMSRLADVRFFCFWLVLERLITLLGDFVVSNGGRHVEIGEQSERCRAGR